MGGQAARAGGAMSAPDRRASAIKAGGTFRLIGPLPVDREQPTIALVSLKLRAGAGSEWHGPALAALEVVERRELQRIAPRGRQEIPPPLAQQAA